MQTITMSDLTTTGNGTAVAEASTLGFGVGEWPDHLALRCNNVPDAKAWLFRRDLSPETQDGEVVSFTYRALVGTKAATITVFND